MVPPNNKATFNFSAHPITLNDAIALNERSTALESGSPVVGRYSSNPSSQQLPRLRTNNATFNRELLAILEEALQLARDWENDHDQGPQ
jgi:hypothetical protein